MKIEDVQKMFRQFDEYFLPISEISWDDDNKVILCDIPDKAYAYDKIVESLFKGNDTFNSFDAISFKDGYINFIEFKNADMKNEKRGLRLKVAEGLHYIEKVLLDAKFLSAYGIPTRFILVYSKNKNQKYLNKESKGQKALNDGILAWSTLPKYRPFISDKYDKKWQYVDTAESLNEEEFMEKKDLYV